jgi:hypothetical protein
MLFNTFAFVMYSCGRRDSSVGIATRYGLDGLGIESGRSQWPSSLKARVCGQSFTGVTGLTTSGGMDVCVVCDVQKIKKQVAIKCKQRTRKKSPGKGLILRTRRDRHWGPPGFLYKGYRVCLRGVKLPGSSVNHPPPSSAEVKERVELYLYSSSEPSWHAPGWALHSAYILTININLFLLIKIINYVLRSAKWRVPQLKSRKSFSVIERSCLYTSVLDCLP